MDELARWDAVETATRLRRGDVSAREVVEAAILRAEGAAHLGGLVTETFSRALDAPSAGSTSERPFAGVPTAIKDLARVAQVPTRWGSRGAGPSVPKRSDPIVGTFEALGFVSLGKSAAPELGLTATTEPLGFAPARNPWAPTRTAGGSSGGAAVLVAAGVVPLAHGSDGGGSIRIPAACCGLVGLKATRGRLDMAGSNLLPVNIAVDGVLTRTVRDTVAFWEAVTGRRGPSLSPRPGGPPAPLRVGFFLEHPYGLPLDEAVADTVRRAARACEALGHRVEATPSPIDEAFVEDFLAYWAFVGWLQTRTHRLLAQRDFDLSQLDPWTRGLATTFARAKGAGLWATARLRGFSRRFRRTFERFDVVLGPTLAQRPPALGELSPAVEYETKRQRLRAFTPYTAAYNASGCPALTLPLGRDEAGVPLGVQLGADWGNERALFELALQLEAALPWPQRAP